MVHMGDIISELEKQQLRDKVNVIVGGAPVNEDFAKKINADGYSPDATSAVQLIEGLTSG